MLSGIMRGACGGPGGAPKPLEFAQFALFFTAWLFPVVASYLVGLSGKKFSTVAPHWQNQNLDLIALGIIVSLGSGLVGFVCTITFLHVMKDKFYSFFLSLKNSTSTVQRVFLFIVFIFSFIGLFLSFGGVISEKSYSGPSVVWLGYGAWSVTFLIVATMLFSDFVFRKSNFLLAALLVTLFCLPFLLSGSRIDFFSAMLALAAYQFTFGGKDLLVRLLKAAAVFIFAIFVAFWIGQVRYIMHDSDNGHASQLVKSFEGKIVPFSISNDSIYLSTLGDIGVSVFQVVGLLQSGEDDEVGLIDATYAYTLRFLPGPIFPNRAADFSSQLSESIGGGSLHAMGEGYLVSGLSGTAIVGLFFGIIISISIFSARYLMLYPTPYLWIAYLFPWLLLVRGGWYQFFSMLKSIEIFILLIIMLLVLNLLGGRFRRVFGSNYR